jgi:hypothetical protein
MTNREFAELREKLAKASDRELAFILIQMGEGDPFALPQNRLLLPSTLRAKVIDHIEALFRNGLLTAKKNG